MLFYHIFSHGDLVLFRDHDDYIFFCNKYGILSHKLMMHPLALTVMSTHFHSIVEPSDSRDLEQFFTMLKRSYSVYYSKKYSCSISDRLSVSEVEINGIEMLRTELLYVAKNPVHHYVTAFPLEYDFNSMAGLFMDKLVPAHIAESYRASLTEFAMLPQRRKRDIASYENLPDNWKVDSHGMISFDSYIDEKRARAFWNGNVKSFLYDMNKNQTDAAGKVIQYDTLDIRSNCMTDIEVCRIIDDYAREMGAASFHHLNPSQQSRLSAILSNRGVPQLQIRRCLWL